jgi:hypothetical protein
LAVSGDTAPASDIFFFASSTRTANPASKDANFDRTSFYCLHLGNGADKVTAMFSNSTIFVEQVWLEKTFVKSLDALVAQPLLAYNASTAQI